MDSFHVFCTLLAVFSLVGFLVSSFLLKKHFVTKKVKVDTPDQEKRQVSIVFFFFMIWTLCKYLHAPVKKQSLQYSDFKEKS